jgi:hypothetical protein
LIELDLNADEIELSPEEEDKYFNAINAPGQGKAITNLCENMLMT